MTAHACIDGYAEAIGEVNGSSWPLYFKDDGAGSWLLIAQGNPTSTANTTGVPDSIDAQLEQAVLTTTDNQAF